MEVIMREEMKIVEIIVGEVEKIMERVGLHLSWAKIKENYGDGRLSG